MVSIQLLQALVATDPFPNGGGDVHHPEHKEGHTGVTSLYGPIWDHTQPPSGGTPRNGAVLACTILRAPFYSDYAMFGGPADRNAGLMIILLEWGPVRGYYPEPAKSIFICDSPTLEETAKQAFEAEVLKVNVVPGSQYIGAYVVQSEEMDAWVPSQVEK